MKHRHTHTADWHVVISFPLINITCRVLSVLFGLTHRIGTSQLFRCQGLHLFSLRPNECMCCVCGWVCEQEGCCVGDQLQNRVISGNDN